MISLNLQLRLDHFQGTRSTHMARHSKASWIAAGVAVAAVGWWWCGFGSSPQVSAQVPDDQGKTAQIARGKYLVTIAGCNDCHTPMTMTAHGPAPDMSRMLSGHPAELKITAAPKLVQPWVWAGVGTNTAFAGPWGVSFAINLTPDKVSGMGVWDEARFIKAMRTGRHFGEARPILPPMPWQGLSQATDEDLKSIWAYLQSVPPVKNEVPAPLPPAGPMPHS
jgi:hypothetical protein